MPKEIYTEKHHIVPKCLGGGNEKSNLSVLTAREHFLVHYILTRIHPNNSKIWNACYKMCRSSDNQQRFVPNSKLYEEIKIERSRLNRGVNHFAFGKAKTDAHKKAIGDAQRGKIISEESKEKRRITVANNPTPISEERRQFLADLLRKNNKNARKCLVCGIEYDSIAAVARNFGISDKVTKCRIKSEADEWTEWKYISESNISEETRQKQRTAKLGSKHTDESKSKMGRSGELNGFYGKTHTETSKQKNRNAHLGTIMSEETKIKISESLSGDKSVWFGVTGSANPNFGRVHSEEFCNDIRVRQQGENNSFFGKHHSESTRQHLQENCPNRKSCVIEHEWFPSMKDAARKLNIPVTTIRSRLKSKNSKFKDWNYTDETIRPNNEPNLLQ